MQAEFTKLNQAEGSELIRALSGNLLRPNKSLSATSVELKCGTQQILFVWPCAFCVRPLRGRIGCHFLPYVHIVGYWLYAKINLI